jgi:hypothetical protein
MNRASKQDHPSHSSMHSLKEARDQDCNMTGCIFEPEIGNILPVEKPSAIEGLLCNHRLFNKETGYI